MSRENQAGVSGHNQVRKPPTLVLSEVSAAASQNEAELAWALFGVGARARPTAKRAIERVIRQMQVALDH